MQLLLLSFWSLWLMHLKLTKVISQLGHDVRGGTFWRIFSCCMMFPFNLSGNLYGLSQQILICCLNIDNMHIVGLNPWVDLAPRSTWGSDKLFKWLGRVGSQHLKSREPKYPIFLLELFISVSFCPPCQTQHPIPSNWTIGHNSAPTDGPRQGRS